MVKKPHKQPAKKDSTLKVNSTFEELVKVAVSKNPTPKRQTKKKVKK